jgi:hypothetical protein
MQKGVGSVWVAVAQAVDPGDEALGEQRGVQGVHQVVQRIVAGNAIPRVKTSCPFPALKG